jgi:hypothetical protein
VAEVFAQAARLVQEDPRRRGNCLTFREGEEIIYAGDLHGHRQNLARIIAYCDLPGHPARRLVLQEIIHSQQADDACADHSLDVLLRAVRLKLARPEGVFFLLGNHDVAEVARQEISKQGRGMCKAFRASLEATFGDQAEEVRQGLCDFLRVLPLAARCDNGAFMTHSLPSPGRMKLVDWDILQRPYREDDFQRGGTLYEWTWGRGHTAGQLDDIAARLDVAWFLLGHQPVEAGYEIRHGRALILASDHACGALVTFDAGEPLGNENLSRHVRLIASLSGR